MADPNEIELKEWEDLGDLPEREFPSPTEGHVPLRISFQRSPISELHLHARESLECEVCGVLVGHVYKDRDGAWLEVLGSIRGQSAVEKRTAVTFTQETWDLIHQAKDKDFPDSDIIGWYHTHPGFGVEFSEMDLFIQQNFFPSPTQFALVTDPLAGQTAACVNTDSGIAYIDRFWVDGRVQECRMPHRGNSSAAATSHSAGNGELLASVVHLERRVSQLMQAVDEQKVQVHRFLMSSILFVLTSVVALVGYNMYSLHRMEREPPRILNYMPIPIKVGEENVMLGVGIVEWKVPPGINALLKSKGKGELPPVTKK